MRWTTFEIIAHALLPLVDVLTDGVIESSETLIDRSNKENVNGRYRKFLTHNN
jgi:hypothetical protein